MSDQKPQHPAAVPPHIRGIHHSAYRCRDAAETRHFYETVMGLKLAAALVFDTDPGTQQKLDYMHLFFEMGDGHYIAFFDAPDLAEPAHFERKSAFEVHFAFEVADKDELLAFKQRFRDFGYKAYGPFDHGFVHSVGTYDPNGWVVEITCRDANHDRIMEEEAAHSDAQMAAWTAATRDKKMARLKLPSAA
jgi:catechol 2,3-dioxygenase-like lactoylglutathione lyase family enzyme